MITLIPYLLLLLAIIVVWKREYQRYAQQKYEMRMEHLQDQLRRLAIKGEVDPRSKIYQYLDDSITTSIRRSYFITLPTIFHFHRIHKSKQGQQLMEFRNAIENIKNNDEKLGPIIYKFQVFTITYVFEQELFFNCLRPLAKMAFWSRDVKNRLNSRVKSIVWLPETSAASKYNIRHGAVC
ncbi:hypothetical protein [Dyadobacter fermentans]|uniref:hypothetical protein n=1 Tax=Dyadobacter fermentans TaxID=94254 RepID=UPI001CC05800|nr:hypothetical protein [Dyadobacter fermentans]MBZ1362474.1 hypothetical protein [Dyadobacter fermentans]